MKRWLTVYRPSASRVLAGAIFVICGVGLLALLSIQGVAGLLRYGWWIAAGRRAGLGAVLESA